MALLARGSTPEHSADRPNGLPLQVSSAITTTMNFRQLKYFDILAEERHFSRAAARLGIAQSPLSRTMKEFQKDLGTRLLTTTTRNTRLTPAGESFRVEAQRILSSIDHAQWMVKALVSNEQMSLRVGLYTGCLSSRVSTLVSCLRARNRYRMAGTFSPANPLGLIEPGPPQRRIRRASEVLFG